jgi:hypothetical protein
VTAAVAAASLIAGGLAAGLGRLAGGTAGKQEGPNLPPAAGPTPAGPARASTASPRHRTTAKPGKVPPGTAVGPASDVPVGQAASFTIRHRRSVHRDPAELRHVRGVRRGMPARRVHSEL